MREILFRGKRLNNGEWIEGYYYREYYSAERMSILHSIMKNKKGIAFGGVYVDPETVSQYTGLTDKNGVKIFEGDVIRSCGGIFYQGVYEYDYTEIVR